MKLEKGEHVEIRCDKCKHRIRYHENGQFACIVPGCDCKKIEPIEVTIKDENQADIISIKKDGKVIVSGSM